MAASVSPVPEGFTTLTPHIAVRGASKAIEFYKKAFGAEEMCRMPGPDGETVMHAELQIGNARLMLGEEMPQSDYFTSPAKLSGTTLALHLYVEDVDKAFQRATDAGATVTMPVMDAFWGDRYGKVTDPFGHEWSLATHMKDLTPEEMQAGAEEFFANMG